MPKIIVSPAALAYLQGRQAVVYRARYRGCCGGQVFDYEIMLLKGKPPMDSAAWQQDGATVLYPAKLPDPLTVSIDLATLLWFKKLSLKITAPEGFQCELP